MSPTTTKDSGMCPGGTSLLVCLPPISDNIQLIWTQAELTNELDDHPELLHTFSYFPYPTMPEIALLCLRCGLQMEKVKTWFMVQRIRCGISWSSEEIEETRSRLMYSQDQLHFKPLVAMAKKYIFQSPEKPAACVSTAESREQVNSALRSQITCDATPEAKKMRMYYPTLEAEKSRANMFNTERKIPSLSRINDHSDTYGQHVPDLSIGADSQSELRNTSRIPVAGHIFGVNETQASPATASYLSDEEHCKRMEKPSCTTDGLMSAQGYGYQEQNSGGSKRQRKTKEQLAVLKSFFLKCQWACREDYKMLEEITGLPRSDIIQWFGDTRYALKHGQLKWFRDNAQGRPSWLDEPQHLVTNGKPFDPKLSGSPVSGNVTPVADFKDIKLSIQPTGAVPIQAPEVQGGYISNKSSDSITEKAPDNMVITLISSSGTVHTVMQPGQDMPGTIPPFTDGSRTEGQIIPPDLQTTAKTCPPTPSPMLATFSQVDYGVLERYWSVHHHIKEDDCQSLAAESGLSREQVLDWFCRKSEPAEVELCLEEEGEEEEEEDEEGEEGEEEEEEDEDMIEDYDKLEVEEEDEYDVVIQD
ncbi:homeobox and leucine zipper protein Homez [Pelobates fuscus]|uniref:homeobox and leucine zipper protein Homez n=1 Tax=Pelobates fuscus TaxID=191477 RepID=UPI002FE4E3E7